MNDFWKLLENIPYYQNVWAMIKLQRAQQINPATGKVPSGWSIIPMAFAYSTNFNVTPAQIPAVVGANFTNNIGIQADSDFVCLAKSYWAYVAAGTAYAQATQIIPNWTILETDTGSSKQYSDNPQPIFSTFGTGQFPFVLPQPIYLAAKSNLAIKATNIVDTTNIYVVYLTYHGIKIFVTEGSP
jgi:hypothetical protein